MSENIRSRLKINSKNKYIDLLRSSLPLRQKCRAAFSITVDFSGESLNMTGKIGL
jgi:hypothetical protein